MKIISGILKGRRIEVSNKLKYRPTLSRIREDIFNILLHNPDIKSIVPDIVSANANPDENVSALDKLMGTTFVSQVDKQTLSIIVPVLARGLRSRDVQSKRKCCVVVDNMCKLVCDPKDVEPFIDKLLPELIKVEQDVPIPEIREYGKKARNTLSKAIEEI